MPALDSFPTGARVRKGSAIIFDFAYGRAGTVTREPAEGHVCTDLAMGERCVDHGDVLLGVVWDGSNLAFEYPPDTIFEEDTDAAAPPPVDG